MGSVQRVLWSLINSCRVITAWSVRSRLGTGAQDTADTLVKGVVKGGIAPRKYLAYRSCVTQVRSGGK